MKDDLIKRWFDFLKEDLIKQIETSQLEDMCN